MLCTVKKRDEKENIFLELKNTAGKYVELIEEYRKPQANV